VASILSLTEFFKVKLNAPMLNNRWSWGSIKSDGSAVILSVWQDEIKRDDPKDPLSPTWVDLLWDEVHWNEVNGGSLARDERIKHITLIKSGIPGFGLIKVARDIKAVPREMKEFNSDYLPTLRNNFRITSSGVLQVEIGEKLSI
jgi:hypothetical protein